MSDISNKLVFKYESGTTRPEQIDRQPVEADKMLPPGGGASMARPRPPFRGMHLYNYAFTSLFLIFFSLGLRVLERNSQMEELQKETEKEKLNSELLFLKSDYKIKRINFNDILYIEGLKDYVKVYTQSSPKPVMSLTTMKLLESKLPEAKFMRVHRSFIVNLERIDTIERSRIVFGKHIFLSVTSIKKNSRNFWIRIFCDTAGSCDLV